MLNMEPNFLQPEDGFFVDAQYQQTLSEAGLDSLDAVFSCRQGQSLTKANLASWRHRIRLQLPGGQTVYLKRYVQPPLSIQVKGWTQHGQHALLSEYDKGPLEELSAVDVRIPETIAYGGQWSGLFEKKSFIITLEIPNAHSLETALPECFESAGSHRLRRDFILKLADFIRRFHKTGYRHRDLYLCHIFVSNNETLYLIDLHRTFKPKFLGRRYQVKDLAQLHYSCPGDKISRADRVRFYLAYTQKKKLSSSDKVLIQKIHSKALRIARHDRKQGRAVPFEMRAAK
ncbi:MAG: lipopolysaccharide kinase InaA family protein [Planctomycetota bacterium]